MYLHITLRVKLSIISLKPYLLSITWTCMMESTGKACKLIWPQTYLL